MKQFIRYLIIGISILTIAFGVTWIFAKHLASPAPSGEAYHYVGEVATGMRIQKFTK